MMIIPMFIEPHYASFVAIIHHLVARCDMQTCRTACMFEQYMYCKEFNVLGQLNANRNSMYVSMLCKMFVLPP
jgi:hypothetical protein